MIELTNAYSYFASAILLLGWILTNKQKGSKSVFGFGFFIAFIIYLISSYLHFSDPDQFLKKLSLELFALAGASYILSKLKSSILLNIILFVLLLIGFSQYAFHHKKSDFIQKDEIAMEGEFILELGSATDIKILGELKNKYQFTTTKAFYPKSVDQTDLDDFYIIDIPNADNIHTILQELKDIDGVDWVEYNENINLSPMFVKNNEENILRKSKSPITYNDQLVNKQWAFDILNMDQYHEIIQNYKKGPQKRSLLAILDTGIDASHEDIKDNYKSISTIHDTDQKGHGTHCAGIAAAVSNNKIGIASFSPNNSWVNITSVKVLNKNGAGTQAEIIKGIILAADIGADVISMSLGARANLPKERAYKQAIEYANSKGAIVVVAAGNSNQNANNYTPANTHMAITVSAIDNNKNKAKFSNYFTDMKYAIAAPGVEILSTIPTNGYTTYSGTSMAAPHVAGLIAIMKAINPSLNTQEAIHILKKTGMETKNTSITGKLINPPAVLDMMLD